MKIQYQNYTWYPVCHAHNVKNKPFAVKLNNIPIVLVRLNVSLLAFKDICPHRGVPLSLGKIKSNCLECAYHGWQFNEKGELALLPGSFESTSINKPLLSSYEAIEQEGVIWLKINEEDSQPYLPTIMRKSDNNILYDTKCVFANSHASLIDILENFLDPMHTHYVHSRLVRDPVINKRKPCTVNIRNTANGYEAVYVEQGQQSGLLSRLFGSRIKKSIGRIIFPGIVELEYISENRVEFSVLIFPFYTEGKQCKIFIKLFIPKTIIPGWFKFLFLKPFLNRVLKQDINILRHQHNSLKNNPDFLPIVTRFDIMRPYIQSVLKGEIEETDVKLKINV